MKKFRIVLSVAASLLATGAFAQTGVSTGTPFGSGQDSIRCRQNISLFSSFAKGQSFQDAYEPWRLAYEECPASSKNIYIYGAKILRWKYDQEKDPKKKKEWLEKLLAMYDSRAKYFGDDPRYTRDMIAGVKAAEYVTLSGDAIDYQKLYDWLVPVVEEFKEATAPQALYYFTYASQALARGNEKNAERYINDFMKAEGYMDKQIEALGEDSAKIKQIEAFKNPMDAEFARSGLASCDMLQKIYTPEKVTDHKQDKAYLQLMTLLFQAADCEAPVYFTASRYLFELEPSAGAAMGLAGEAINSNKYAEAKDWLKKAVELSKDNKDRAKCYEVLAQLSMKQGQYGEARSYCNQALSENPRSGKSYIMIAQMIASSADNIFPTDKVKQRCVYYLVIDKLNKAASVDPNVSAKANGLIARYRKNLPSASDIFMHPDLEKGKSFFVGGWVGESTTIR